MRLSPRKIATIAWFEFFNTIMRRSVLLVMFGLPLVTMLLFAVSNRLAAPPDLSPNSAGISTNAASLLSGLLTGEAESLPSGLVDKSGRVHNLPANTPFVLFESQTAAEAAFASGTVINYYIIPANYVQEAVILHYAPSVNYPRKNVEQSALYRILALNLLSEERLARQIVDPANFAQTDISPDAGLEGNSGGAFGTQFLVGFGVALLFFATTMGSSGYLLQSLGKEKQNRVIEILLSSIHARELLIGKILGLGAIGFVQLISWSVVALLLLGQGTQQFANLPLPALSLEQWSLIALFFISGYFVYASLYAGLGALAPNPKEGSQYAFLIILPVLIPLWFNNIFWSAPDSTPVVLLSLFPMTAPLAMPMRLVVSTVPASQIALSLALILSFAIAVILLVTRLFRGQVLVSGQSLSLGSIWRTLRGR